MCDSVVIPIYYATDRQALVPLEVWKKEFRRRGTQWPYYGSDYDSTRLELGVCPVNVPAREHQLGMVERPGWYASEGSPSKYFAITTLDPLEPESFFASLNRQLTNSCCRDVFVFIHGYNVTFSTAMLYTTQLTWDWDFTGIPILYSWPSSGTLLGYPRDEESIRLTEGHLRFFLKELLARTAATNVHLIAHSMGNRALTEVLKSLASEPNQPLFNEIVLAAPDVNRVGFLQDIAEALPKVARRVTLYASSADKALRKAARP